VKGSLRGMPSITYYNIERLEPSNLIIQASNHLPSNIWKKLDRHHPVNPRQKAMIKKAMNMAARELVRGYPIDVPVVVMSFREYYGNKRICYLKAVKIFSFLKKSTEYGTAYCLYGENDKDKEIEFNGQKGHLGFSSHVFDRLFERIPELEETCRFEDCSAILKILGKAIQDDVILTVDDTPMLQAYPKGFFPLLYDEKKSLWVCKTYLEEEMDGTPKLDEDLARILKKIVEK